MSAPKGSGLATKTPPPAGHASSCPSRETPKEEAQGDTRAATTRSPPPRWRSRHHRRSRGGPARTKTRRRTKSWPRRRSAGRRRTAPRRKEAQRRPRPPPRRCLRPFWDAGKHRGNDSTRSCGNSCIGTPAKTVRGKTTRRRFTELH